MSDMSAADLAKWKIEFTTDPGIPPMGYLGKTHAEIEKLLLTTERDVDNDQELKTGRLFEQLDPVEYLAVSDGTVGNAAKRVVLTDLLRLGDINPAAKVFRKAIDFVFGSTSETAKNLNKLKKRKGRRWEELGLPKPDTSDIANSLK